MKSILISIQPKWVEKILNGEKTIEIRKTAPKCKLPIDVYIYCTKNKSKIIDVIKKGEKPYYLDLPVDKTTIISYIPDSYYNHNKINGKVVAKFTLREYIPIAVTNGGMLPLRKCGNKIGFSGLSEILNSSFISKDEAVKYADKNEYIYAWYIEDLQIFDEPKELDTFKKSNLAEIIKNIQNNGCGKKSPNWCGGLLAGQCHEALCPVLKVTRPPQSWQYIEVWNEI